MLCLPVINLQAFAACPQFLPGQQVGTIGSSAINEASGIAASRKNHNILWTHNDSGDSARVFAINTSGHMLGVYTLNGTVAIDFEDIAVGPGPLENMHYLYIGDIGDNNATRPCITVYRVAEPNVVSSQSPVAVSQADIDTIKLQFPDGPRDAETLMVDPRTRDIYIISKRDFPSKVYRAAYPQSTSQTTTMQLVANLPFGLAVGGDISPTGDLVIVKGYFSSAWLWKVEKDAEFSTAFAKPACSIPVLWEPQGEAICFNSNGCGYFTLSEGSYQPLYYFPRDIEPLTANLDGDCDVDMYDYSVFASKYADSPNDSAADLDGNGYVDVADLAIFAAQWLRGKSISD